MYMQQQPHPRNAVPAPPTSPVRMDSFFEQLDRFLSALTLGGFGSLTQDLHRRDVLTHEERRLVDERLSDAGREEARGRLMGILRTKRDLVKLRAVSQALQAFQLLYKDTKSHREEEKKKHDGKNSSTTTRADSKPKGGGVEVAILAMFEDGNLLHTELKKHLQKAKESLDLTTVTNFEGKTLLHLSCCLLTLKTVKLLVDGYGFDIMARDNEGNTPLHDAARCQKTEVLDYLLTCSKCNPNMQNQEGNTPLHVAMTHSHWEVGRTLLGCRGLRVPITNEEGDTPVTLIDMQLTSPETKKMRKDLISHPSMKKFKHQDSGKDLLKKPPPMAVAKDHIHFNEAINAVRKSTAPPPPTTPPTLRKVRARFDDTVETETFKPGSVEDKPMMKRASPVPSPTSSLHLSLEPSTGSVPPSPRKGVTMIDDVEIIELKEEDDYEEDTTESWFSGFCAGCFSSNPPVICVLLLMVLGLVLACVIIGVAGGLLLK